MVRRRSPLVRVLAPSAWHQWFVGGVYRPMKLRSVLLLGASALLAACSLFPGASLSPKEAALRALAQHQAQWASKNIDDYAFTITAQCFCPFTDPIDITVVDGVVTAVTKAGQPAKPNEVQGIPKTVTELFAVITAHADAAALSVEWDPAFGFPSTIQVDSIANAVDDEFAYLVTNFRPAS